MKFTFLFFIALTSVSCSTPAKNPHLEKIFKYIPDTEYLKIVDQFTQNDKKYNGFYNTYEVGVTIFNTTMTEALLQREGYYMQWNESQALSEREKALQKMTSSSEFYITLYTPEPSHNDMNKANSMWKVYLEYEGQRYEGQITKFKKNLIQSQHLFPHHTRFNTSYIATFNIPMSRIENGKVSIVLSSSLGNSTFVF